jgi:hypothetical protein
MAIMIDEDNDSVSVSVGMMGHQSTETISSFGKTVKISLLGKEGGDQCPQSSECCSLSSSFKTSPDNGEWTGESEDVYNFEDFINLSDLSNVSVSSIFFFIYIVLGQNRHKICESIYRLQDVRSRRIFPKESERARLLSYDRKTSLR